MPTITQISPTKILLEGFPDSLKTHLTYIDKSVNFELNKLKKNKWLRAKLGEEEWKERVEVLNKKRIQCLLFEDSKGLWTYSGLTTWLKNKFNATVVSHVEYPEAELIPWAREPDKLPRYYQEKARDLLLEKRHGAVEIGTGLGKSFIILMLAKELGLKTVVMTPSVSIAEQIHDEFLHHFGKKYVGKFFDGKKDSKKMFVIAVDDSLANVEEGSVHWKELCHSSVFIADESHLVPAKSLAKVCTGLLAEAPYRFFFSGTQMRNDGLDLLLEAITSDIVFRMTVEEGVKKKFLAKPMFRMIPVISHSGYDRSDANEMTREHLYYNSEVNERAAELANLMVEENDRQVVIIIKELEQFAHLIPHLRHEVKFAHGGVTALNKKLVPEAHWDSDPGVFVKEFNEKKFPILIGTNCITTGTDIQTVGCIIYLQGGKSEIAVKQSIGRGTRRPEGKEDCYFIDFDVTNQETLHRHAETRASIYKEVYPDFEELKL